MSHLHSHFFASSVNLSLFIHPPLSCTFNIQVPILHFVTPSSSILHTSCVDL
jgi:hypothetical protein